MSAATQRIASGSEYESRYGFSRAVRDGRRVVVSGTAPIRPDGSCDADADSVSEAHGKAFAEIRPAATMVVVAGLLDPRWKVEIEAEAQLPG